MLARCLLTAGIVLAIAQPIMAQPVTAESPVAAPPTAWRPPAGHTLASGAASAGALAPLSRSPAAEPTPIAGFSGAAGGLPNQHGQLWKAYDISPYTLRVTNTKRPERAIVDWILEETGYEAWHFEPAGVLNADRRTLRVYHTPEMQAVVADVVDRFVGTRAETATFALRVVTVDQPNWRTHARRLVRPVKVRTPGITAWLMKKEDAAILLGELRRRSDYREHHSPHVAVTNGQASMVSTMRPRNYVSEVASGADRWQGYRPEAGQIDEGFTLEFTPLLSRDRKLIDATVKCEINQVEQMIPVMIDVPTAVAPHQRAEIQVPQITQFRFHERFRWPADEILLIGMGVVALPVPIEAKPQSLVPGIPLPGIPLPLTPKVAPRADLLVFLEAQGSEGQTHGGVRTTSRQPENYHGRY